MTSQHLDGETSGARGVIDRVRDRASSQISDQKDRATDSLTRLAQAVRQSTQSLRDNQQGAVAQYVDRAADRIEQFSTTLRERDLNDLMRDAERFARRQPAVFIGAAFAAGVLAARFLKSSSERDDYRNDYRNMDPSRSRYRNMDASGSRLPASLPQTPGVSRTSSAGDL
jgi:ElaB/YqjD/DUF883 family membrane-anchored ribosome-binding protein